ncbi:MAG: hypothetical protein ACI4UE_02440 [Candidatus Scatovivens sp.]
MNYIYNFQDNIEYSSFNSKAKNILNWIEENRNIFDWAKDPNAYEMVNLFLFGAKYYHEGKNINIDTLTKMWDIRSQDFKNCNISPNNFVYNICQDSYKSALIGKVLINDENYHHALRKMAGIGLYLKQHQRDFGQVSYNNPEELLQLLKCSSTLKTFHPDLFDKYAFKENIDVLCKLQLEHELPNEIIQFIKNAKSQIYSHTTKFESSKDTKPSKIEFT